MTIAEQRQKRIEQLLANKTDWLISFVRANKPIARVFYNPELNELILAASEEIKRRNRRAFENRYEDGAKGHY